MTEQKLDKEELKLKIMSAAKDVFLAKGYVKANLDEIIKLTGGSRRNIYNLFGSKEELFIEMVKYYANEIFNVNDDGEVVEYLNLKDSLNNLGTKALLSIFQKDNLRFIHLILTESIQYPEIYTQFNNTVMHHRLKLPLMKIFQKARENNELNCKLDNEFLADFTIATIRGMIDHQILYFYENEIITENFIKNILDKCIHIFINGFCNSSN